MGRYIRVIFINAVIIGLSYWIVFEAFNLKYSAIISLWAFVTNFIPIVGVVLEYIPVLLFSLTLGVKGVLLIALFAILIHAVAFVVFIQLMKGLEKLNPVYIILSILFLGNSSDCSDLLWECRSLCFSKSSGGNFSGPFLRRGESFENYLHSSSTDTFSSNYGAIP